MNVKQVATFLFLVVVSVHLGCTKQEDPVETAGAIDPNEYARLLARAESAEKQLAELRLTVKQARSEQNDSESDIAEATHKMESLATRLAEALQTQDLLVDGFTKAEAERDDALKRAIEQEKTISELSQYLQANEKRINELEFANKELQATLEELAAAIEQEAKQQGQEGVVIE